MLALLRVVAILLGLGVIGFAVAYFRTGDRKHLRAAQRTFVGGLLATLLFFVVMFLQRLFL